MGIDINRLKTVTVDRLNKSGIWWKHRTNIKNSNATSCRQAITVRSRLGSSATDGIPLWSEVKSEIGVVSDPVSKKRIIYASHTRANTDIDREKIKNILGFDVSKSDIKMLLSDEEGKGKHKNKSPFFGLVNPFNIDEICSALGEEETLDSLWQIFDSSILLPAGLPNTIMTNLGNKSEAMEVRPEDLLMAIKRNFPNTIVSEISQPCRIWSGQGGKHKDKLEWLRFPPPTGPKIGILTGNGPG